jgi:hypothetical protein
LIISMATVIGPAPPGTVTYEAFCRDAGKIDVADESAIRSAG